MQKGLGVAGALAGALGAAFIVYAGAVDAARAGPGSLNQGNGYVLIGWGLLYLVLFGLAGWLGWTGRGAGLAVLGTFAVTTAFLGMWSIGPALLPGAVLTATAAMAAGRAPRWMLSAGCAAGILAMYGVQAFSASILALAFPAGLVCLGAGVALMRRGQELAFVAAEAAGFGWTLLALTAWWQFH